MDKYKKAMDRLYRVVLIFASICIISMVLIIFYQVLMRTLFSKTPRWSEEFTISILMLYTGFLGAAVAYRERMHIGIKILLMKMKTRTRGIFFFAIDVVVGLFAVAMIVYGGLLAWGFRGQILPATGISVGLSYLPIPLSGIVFLLFVIEKVAGDFKSGGSDDSFLIAVDAVEE